MISRQAMGAILGRLQAVATINEQYQNAIVSARRLYEVLAAPPTVPEDPGATPLPPGTGAVRFENVTFGYDAAKPVLHDMSFDVPGGSIVAIVGPTGAGKSTLVSLIARFYDPQQGRVFDRRRRRARRHARQPAHAGGVRVSGNVSLQRHRRGATSPTAGRTSATAKSKPPPGWRRRTSSSKRSRTATKRCSASAASSLSGGQRQRLAIARAILTNPRVLILDDATAAVDPETEDLIRRGMQIVMQGRTTFVIAHRISTVKQADW